jgi:DNA-binding transcriptional ArsR family regulator
MLRDEQVAHIQRKIEPSQDELALCDAFRILGDWNRYRMMKTLLEAKELCVSDLARIVGISMSATSQHLRILEMSGLVAGERMGQTICYKPLVSSPKVKALIKLIS